MYAGQTSAMKKVIEELEWFEVQFGAEGKDKLFGILSPITDQERMYLLNLIFRKKSLRIRDFLIKKGLKPIT
jgi:hypothetical protein